MNAGGSFYEMIKYKSHKWKHKRETILRRDKYKCQISNRYGKNVPADMVHHIFPADLFPEYFFCDWNLISLSNDIHNKLHNRITGELTEAGKELLRRTCRKNNIDIPEQYQR